LREPGGVRTASFRSLDGLRLAGTLVIPSGQLTSATVLVHGGGVTREEGGFFDRLAQGLAEAGIASLRFDFRGHGESDGLQEDLTISGVANDIRAAAEHLQAALSSNEPVNLLGTSFGGGITALCAARCPELVRRLVLLNPLLNYKKRFIDDKPYWHADHVDDEEGSELSERGFLAHSPSFKLGRALLNEVFYVEPRRALGQIQAPTLFVHGTQDTFVPVESSRWGVEQITSTAKLIEIDGAQHGFAVHDDPQYRHPQSQLWQTEVIEAVAEWLS